MMNDDKLFRDRLYDIEASYPDDMWDRISSNLPRKRRRGGIWFFFLLAFILVGLLSGILIPALRDHTTENNKELVDRSSVQNLQEKALPVMTTVEEESKSEVENTTSNNLSDTSSDATPYDEPSTSIQEDFPADSRLSEVQKEIKINHQPSDSGNQSEVSSFVRVQMDNERVSPTPVVDEFSELEIRKPVSSPGNIDPLELTIEYGMPEFEQPECPSFGFDRESGIFFDLLYSHDLPQRTLNSKSQELNDYVNSRNNTESTLYSFSASLRIAYISSSGLGLKTGFNYSQINEKFEYLDPDASLIRTIITIDTLIVGGVPTVVSDTSTIRIPGSLDITTYNRYRFFDIPVLATYEAPINDKFSYSINGGILLNLAFTQRGRFLDPSDMPVWFSGSEPQRLDAFRSSAGLSFFGSIGMHYSLNEHLDIIIEPNFRYYAGSLTTEPYPLEQKWLTLGLSHGIRYKF